MINPGADRLFRLITLQMVMIFSFINLASTPYLNLHLHENGLINLIGVWCSCSMTN